MIGDRSRSYLAVWIGGRLFALPPGVVRRVDYVGCLTPLPFVSDGVEGLITVDHRPLLLVDPVRRLRALGLGERGCGDKIVVVDTSVGSVALRVEGVVSHGEPAFLVSEAEAMPSLPIEALVGDLVAPTGVGIPDARAASGEEAPAESVLVLVVGLGAGRVGILIDAGIHVAEVDGTVEVGLGLGDGRVHVMATINNRVLPARRIGGAGGAGRAVVGCVADGTMALLVERLIDLVRVPGDALVRVPGAVVGANLCFPMPGGDPVMLVDFAVLAGDAAPDAIGAAYRRLLARVAAARRPPAASGARSVGDGTAGGVMVTARGVRWLLPLPVVIGMVGVDERGALGRRVRGSGGVPLFDSVRCFGSETAPASASAVVGDAWVALRFADGTRAALRVDHIALEPAGSGGPWLAPPTLPLGLAALVRAVALEAGSGHWCLCLDAGFNPLSRPFALRRVCAAACLGWLPQVGETSAPTQPDFQNKSDSQNKRAHI